MDPAAMDIVIAVFIDHFDSVSESIGVPIWNMSATGSSRTFPNHELHDLHRILATNGSTEYLSASHFGEQCSRVTFGSSQARQRPPRFTFGGSETFCCVET